MVEKKNLVLLVPVYGLPRGTWWAIVGDRTLEQMGFLPFSAELVLYSYVNLHHKLLGQTKMAVFTFKKM